MVRRIESRGALETAHRAIRNCGQVFRYAVATGRAERDPTTDLNGALPPARSRHYPTITDPKAIGDLLRAISGYQGSPITRTALRLAPLVFVRPGELRHAEWPDINLKSAEWRIPPEKMKHRRIHLVPLSRQAITILKELQLLTGHGQYLFPGRRSPRRPMSENTINAALRNLGYDKNQWIVLRSRNLRTQRGWKAVSFIGCEKTTLLRVLREKSVELYPEAQASLDLMPEGFLDWRDQHLTPPPG